MMKTIITLTLVILPSIIIFSQCDITFDHATPTCFESCNGQIVANPTGTAPYEFNWSTGDSEFYIDDLCSGTYILTITDDLGCTHTDSLILEDGVDTFNVEIFYVSGTSSEGFCDGEIGWEISGGEPDYFFQWFDCETHELYDGLPGFCAGDYYLILEDNGGCIDSSNCITVYDPMMNVESDIMINNSYEIFPNPCSDAQHIILNLVRTAAITVDIISVNGSVIKRICDDVIDSGKHSFEVRGSDLPNGLYFYRIIIKNEIPIYFKGAKNH